MRLVTRRSLFVDNAIRVVCLDLSTPILWIDHQELRLLVNHKIITQSLETDVDDRIFLYA